MRDLITYDLLCFSQMNCFSLRLRVSAVKFFDVVIEWALLANFHRFLYFCERPFECSESVIRSGLTNFLLADIQT